MASKTSLSNPDIIFCALIAVALIMLAPVLFPLTVGENCYSPGFCFPSPDSMPFNPFLKQGISALILILSALGCVVLNRKHNFISGNDYSLAAFLLIFCASNPATTAGISDSLILLAVTVIVVSLIFSCYKSPNATQEVYLAATLISAATTILIPAVALLPLLLFGIGYMNIVRIKEVIAIGMGLITPWWILLGLGIIDFSSFNIPEIKPVWMLDNLTTFRTVILLSYCVVLLWDIILWVNNSFSLMSGNVKTRAFIKTISVLGLIAPIFMIFDTTRTEVYSSLLYLAAAVQTGKFFSIHNIRRGALLQRIIILLCIAFFIILRFV